MRKADETGRVDNGQGRGKYWQIVGREGKENKKIIKDNRK